MPSSLQKRPYGPLKRATTFPGSREYFKNARGLRGNSSGRAGFGNVQRPFGMASAMATSRLGQRNFESLCIRIPMEIRYNKMLTSPDGSMFFNIAFCPWKALDFATDLSATPQQYGNNRLYSADIDHMKALYQTFRLGSVFLDLDRPKVFVSASETQSPSNQIGASLFQPTSHVGTQIIKSEVVLKPDSVGDHVQSNTSIDFKLLDTTPSSWREGVDNQSSRFLLHKDRKQIKLNWRPTTDYERKWKDKASSDQELMTGGMHIRFQSKEPIPEIANFSYRSDQVLLQGYANYVMYFKDRTNLEPKGLVPRVVRQNVVLLFVNFWAECPQAIFSFFGSDGDVMMN